MEAKELRRGQAEGKRKGATLANVQQIKTLPGLTEALKMIQIAGYFVFGRFYCTKF